MSMRMRFSFSVGVLSLLMGGCASQEDAFRDCMSPSKVYSDSDAYVRIYNPDGSGRFECVPRPGNFPVVGQ